MDHDFSELLEIYPPIISLEKLYKICHISKRKANWLLVNGIIPCLDSGKKTRRFQIKMTDVIDYLKKDNDKKILIPLGLFNAKTPCKSRKNELFQYLNDPNRLKKLQSFYEHRYSKYPSGLKVKDVAAITGYAVSTVSRWTSKGYLRAYKVAGFLVPKKYLIEFVCSQFYFQIQNKSETHKADMQSFLELLKSNDSGG
ncbi:MAG: helix-turn-helix domain-containing protein [Oscillospiraceae bacterium]|jgi:hypothetical protein|nr:helix-turn-helix domain-containing protein [Oscillospiraceae bacterium]